MADLYAVIYEDELGEFIDDPDFFDTLGEAKEALAYKAERIKQRKGKSEFPEGHHIMIWEMFRNYKYGLSE